MNEKINRERGSREIFVKENCHHDSVKARKNGHFMPACLRAQGKTENINKTSTKMFFSCTVLLNEGQVYSMKTRLGNSALQTLNS